MPLKMEQLQYAPERGEVTEMLRAMIEAASPHLALLLWSLPGELMFKRRTVAILLAHDHLGFQPQPAWRCASPDKPPQRHVRMIDCPPPRSYLFIALASLLHVTSPAHFAAVPCRRRSAANASHRQARRIMRCHRKYEFIKQNRQLSHAIHAGIA